MKLADLQTHFQHALLSTNNDETDWIADSVQGLSARKRLDIYHNAYRVRLTETLLDTFEHTADYITHALFEELALTYIEQCPSTQTNIGLYGQHFSNHLKEALPNCQEVAEIAEMDWLLRRAFDGPNTDVMTKQTLEQLAISGTEITHLTPVPTLCLRTQHFNSLEIWQAVNQDIDIPTVNQLPEPMALLIWRKNHSPHFRSLSDIEMQAIQSLQSGHSIETLCETLHQSFPKYDIAIEFGNLLGRWLDEGILSA